MTWGFLHAPGGIYRSLRTPFRQRGWGKVNQWSCEALISAHHFLRLTWLASRRFFCIKGWIVVSYKWVDILPHIGNPYWSDRILLELIDGHWTDVIVDSRSTRGVCLEDGLRAPFKRRTKKWVRGKFESPITGSCVPPNVAMVFPTFLASTPRRLSFETCFGWTFLAKIWILVVEHGACPP